MNAPEEPRALNKCEMDELLHDLGPAGPAHELFDRWLRWHRHQHPEDTRSTYDLIDDHVAWRDRKEASA